MVESTQIVIAIVAIYAAILSTLNQYFNWKNSSTRIRADLSWGVYRSGDSIKEGYLIQISNSGGKSIKINSIELPLPNKNKIYYALPLYQNRLPSELKSFDTINIVWDEKEIDKSLKDAGFEKLKNIRISTSDSLGNKYYSNYIERRTKKKYGRFTNFFIMVKEGLNF